MTNHFYLLTKDLSNEFENNVAEELLLTIHDWFLLTEQAPDKTNTPLLLDGKADKKVLKDYGLRFTKSDKHLYRVSLPRATHLNTIEHIKDKGHSFECLDTSIIDDATDEELLILKELIDRKLKEKAPNSKDL